MGSPLAQLVGLALRRRSVARAGRRPRLEASELGLERRPRRALLRQRLLRLPRPRHLRLDLPRRALRACRRLAAALRCKPLLCDARRLLGLRPRLLGGRQRLVRDGLNGQA